ncbi:MAG: beta-galactosidase, partial [Bacteroidales bacterium]
MIIKNTKQVFVFLILIVLKVDGFSQTSEEIQQYRIDITGADKEVYSGHLKLGGKNYKGEKISVNNYYLLINDKPVIPVTGEFHFSRYPEKYWDESIRKMKAGGINVIATYVFWIIHEEKEGKFDWSGDKNLRKFVELCGQKGLKVIVRIGPFCHGEIRNGGLPDWLLGKPLNIRSNDPEYLSYVERLYRQISLQLKDLLFDDGGPVFAIQLENEYQHSAAPWGLTYPDQPYDFTSSGRDREITAEGAGSAVSKNPYAHLGNEHMKVLKSIAVQAGLKVPVYTATGWGNAAIIENECMPVTGAYAYPTWASSRLSPLYLFTDLHNNPDYPPVRYKPLDYPYFAAEISGGIMVRYNRRPIVPPQSLDALITRFLGSGTNGIGYYMFHG